MKPVNIIVSGCQMLSASRFFGSSGRRYTTTVGVIGLGQMGSGIAKVAVTTSKLPCILMDKDPQALQRAKNQIGTFIHGYYLQIKRIYLPGMLPSKGSPRKKAGLPEND